MTVLASRTKGGTFTLADADKERLERLAPLFDVEFRRSEDGHVHLTVADAGPPRCVVLPAAIAHTRLLTELCAKCVNWVYFRDQEHCGKTLLSLPDAKLRRIAELYALRRTTQEKAASPQ